MMLRRAVAAIVAATLLAACTGGSTPRSGSYPGEDWSTEGAGQAGFDPTKLQAIGRRLQAANSTCFVVTRHGKVVHQEYFRGAGVETMQPAYSVTKSFTSMLVGIAADRDDLALDDPASSYIPAWRGTRSSRVTIRDLLSNTSGRHWDLTSDYKTLAVTAPNKTAFAVGLGQDAPPGTVWVYNNSAIQTLQAVLKAATGMEPAAYAKRHIFGPLGMERSVWNKDEAGNSMTFSGVNASCLDLARFGYLMLRHGRWKGKQIVSADYVEKATERSSSTLNAAYGLLWWVNQKGRVTGSGTAMGGGGAETTVGRLAPHTPSSAFWALGAGRQIISVVPSKGIVAIRMGGMPVDPQTITPDSFTGGILAALR